MKIMGTGSRSMITRHDRVEIYQNLEAEVLRLAAKYPELHLISGMAEGWDEAIAKAAMRNGIPYSVYIPNNGYGRYYWGDHSLLGVDRMHQFNELVLNATERIVVCKSVYENGVHANFIRNQAMVDACDGALVYDPTSSGTKDAVARLNKAGKPMKAYPFSPPVQTKIGCACPKCDHVMIDLGACRCHFDGGCGPDCIYR